jgi:UTP--glucose-1-phosphate uridylyltransferase
MGISTDYLNRKYAPFEKRMAAKGMPNVLIKTFRHYYAQLLEGHKGLIPESTIRPLQSVPDSASIPDRLEERGRKMFPRTVYLKLNGGLGTSMGLDRAKSSLIAKNGYSFLDIIARYCLREKALLLLMNSFATHAESELLIEKYPDLRGNQYCIPLDFLQHQVPKVQASDLSPAVWPENPDLEWCPPGHGDIFLALATSRVLDLLIQQGYEFMFISNADNLGATIDARILGHFAENRIPFMVEVADRTESDKKGGHIAQLPNGRLLIREVAQCPASDLPAFQDISRHRFFNTNSIWLHLPSLKSLLLKKDHILGLSLIRNPKTVDPRDPDSPPVYQLETAMGSAISAFKGSEVIRVPRSRFIPIKNTTDLLALRSDAYVLTEDFRLVPSPDRSYNGLSVDLDPCCYRIIDDLELRFPHGAPSMIDCESLSIRGDVVFDENVSLTGRVIIVNESGKQQTIPAGSVLEGSVSLQDPS